jgi:cell division protein FtsI (penicillin-binding protein 3)
MTRPQSHFTKDWSGPKIIFLAVVFTCCWLALWARAYYVQIVRGEVLSKQANRQYWSSQYLEGERGELLDRKGRLLAKSVPTRSVYIRPLEVENTSQTVDALYKVLGGSKARIKKMVRQKKNFVWIARKIGDRQVAALRELKLPGVYLKEDRLRMYPQGHLAGQLLGFVGMDGKGLEGLERSLGDILSASGEKRVVQRDAAGHTLYQEGEAAVVNGKNVYLTLDSVIQSAAEDALADAVRTFHGKTGVCLVVEVGSGDILAWAHYPFFDPNRYTQSSPVVWRNRLCLDMIEPGSTFKPFVVAAALQKRICTPSTLFFCENGTWTVGRHPIRDTHPYEWLSVDRIVRYSSNIGMSKVGLSMGADTLYSQLKRFGFLAPTGLPVPGEGKGLIRPPQAWTDVDLAAASFGQGIAVTPLQMARAYVALGNKGKMKTLHLLRDRKPDPSEPRVVDQHVADEVLAMLQGVVEKDGTGTRARISGMNVGGKTGTAQKPNAQGGGYGDSFVASFVGFIPAKQPKYFILAMVDEPHPQHYGGVVAAPVVQKVATKLLAYRGESPEEKRRPGVVAADKPHIREVAADTEELLDQTPSGPQRIVPNLCGTSLRRAVATLIHQGVVPQIMGEGIFVERQVPRAGSSWPANGARKCQLWLTAERSDS